MNRRKFLIASGLTGAAVAVGGIQLGRGVYARHQLAKKFMSDAMPELTQKAHTELNQYPVRARDLIRTWFHAPCLNSAEFVYEICSNTFAEKLSACSTAELKEQYFVNTFVSRVISETEILNQVSVINEEIGSELDRNWATCCEQISDKWDIHLKPHGSTMPNDFVSRLEPFVRKSLNQAIQCANVAGQKPAIGETAGNVGKSALSVLPVIVFPKIAIPLFTLLALRHLFAYIIGQLNNKVSDYQRAISDRVAMLGTRIGSEFESEIKTRIGALHLWQEDALKGMAEVQAQECLNSI